MQTVYTLGSNIVSSLGFTTQENWAALLNNTSGIKSHDTGSVYGNLPLSLINRSCFEANAKMQIDHFDSYTFFEQIMIWSAKDAIVNSGIDASNSKTIFIISTTKGNVEELKTKEGRRSNKFTLWNSAKKIAAYFQNTNEAIVVSNACVSGVVALNTAKQLLQGDDFHHAVVIGADVVSDFVIAGFMSFQALSSQSCKPFDKSRDGLTLGEAAGCLVLSNQTPSKYAIIAGVSSNDANHISGPSRTGEGLFLAMHAALNEAGKQAEEIDFISAHGTATMYNDAMESIALTRLRMNEIPLNSFKAYWGHTLGAAGIIEVIASIESMKNNKLIKSLGFTEQGAEEKLNIITENTDKEIKILLKTAAGFGGSNASLIIEKVSLWM